MENNMSSLAGSQAPGSKAGMIAVSVGLLIIGLVAGYAIGKSGGSDYASSPTPSASQTDTSNWKTYTNTKVGYSVSYPSSYTYKNHEGPSDSTIWEEGDENTRFRVIYRLDSVDGSIRTWFDTAPVGDITLAGRAGKKFVYQYCDGPGCGPETVAYVVQHDSKLLAVEFFGDYELDQQELQILSTFKFIN